MGRLGFNATVVLKAISEGCTYGFEIMEVTGLSSGIVYPILRRYEAHGLLESRWEDGPGPEVSGRPKRRYYALSERGRTTLQEAVERIRAHRGMFLPEV